MLQLGDCKRKDLIAYGFKVSQQLVDIFGLEVLQEVLDVYLNVGLFVTVAVLLLFYVLHAWVLLAFLLPVGLLGDVSCRHRDRQINIGQFYDLVERIRILNAFQVGVHLEILCNDSQRDLLQRLDLIGGEGGVTSLFSLHDGLGDEAIIECFLLIGLFLLSFGCFA